MHAVHSSIRTVATAFVAASAALGSAVAGAQTLCEERWRPGFHFSPAQNWMNEPNGMIYAGGLWHVFFQHNPHAAQWGNMTWGHATSPDLLHWFERDDALEPAGPIMQFSGTSVLDTPDTLGLNRPGQPAVIAAYTGWDHITGIQDQRIAYSVDGGQTFTKLPGNPVLDVGSNEIRDPKLIWNEDTQDWTMMLSHGGQKRLSFWKSDDLRDWRHVNDFRDPTLPGDISGWEVPDLFELPIEGEPGQRRWVLEITPATGSPAGGNGVLYWVGDFTGEQFFPEQPAIWADYGRDFDGVIIFSATPPGDDRIIWTGVMNSYGESIPTSPWRGNLSLPRQLSLARIDGRVRLLQEPIDELASIRETGWTRVGLTYSPGDEPLAGSGISGDMMDIIAVFEPGDAETFGFDVAVEGTSRTRVGYDTRTNRFFMDRTRSGLLWNPDAGNVHFAPLEPDANGRVRMRIVLDRSVIEAFGGRGEAVISNLILPPEGASGVELFATGGRPTVRLLQAYRLREALPAAPEPGTPDGTVARWDLSGGAQFALGYNPISYDRARLPGEGTRAPASPYEPTASVENLYRFNGRPLEDYTESDETPPAHLFRSGESGGDASYDASGIAGVEGALFYPQNLYGNEFAFTGDFTIELYFKTEGDQRFAGRQQLILQGEENFRYGIILNEGGPGNVRFAVGNQRGAFATIDSNAVTGRSFADGQWHALAATWDRSVPPNGVISLEILSEDGQRTRASGEIPIAFGGLPFGNDGNLLIGRHDFSIFGDHRTFMGLIDEIRITAGVVPPAMRLAPSACPGDVTGDRAADFWDLLEFIRLLDLDRRDTDLNRDGRRNAGDVRTLLLDIRSGCL